MAVNPLSGLARFFGRAISDSAGYGIGGALQRPLAPLLQELTNETWRTSVLAGISIPVDAGDAAEIVAEDVEALSWGEDQAAQGGMTPENFRALVGAVENAPGVAELFELWRRDLIDDAAFEHGLRKARLETRWDGPLMALKETLLSSEELAMLQQQGFIPESRANAEGGLQGVTEERQQLRFEASGLPPGIIEGLQLLRRGQINEARFAQIVREGHTKTKYTADLLTLRRALLTPHEYEEAALRGIITRAEADAGAALSGIESADADLLFEIMGRPLAVHQITTGLARGGTFGGTYADVPEPYRDAIRRSNIRPEYARLAYANRYSYPSAFVLRSLAQAGELGDEAAVQTILEQIGWPPELAAKVAPSWVGGGTTGDTHVAKAQTQLWGTTHRSYVNDRIDQAAATAALGSAGVPAASIPAVLATWNAERDLIRAGLSAAQIKKAYRENAFTVDEAVARLVELGWSVADAQTFLPL